ncbi:MAG: hypothetical protein Q9212_003266 [Teloschistes hypoglaucus]
MLSNRFHPKDLLLPQCMMDIYSPWIPNIIQAINALNGLGTSLERIIYTAPFPEIQASRDIQFQRLHLKPVQEEFMKNLVPHGILQPSGYDQNVPRMVEFTEYPAGFERTTIGGQTFEGYPEPRYTPQDSQEHPPDPMNAEIPGYCHHRCPRPTSQGFLVSAPQGAPLRHAKHIGLPTAREQAVRTQSAGNESHRPRKRNPSMVPATTRGIGLYTNGMIPTQKRRRRRFSDVEKARIRVVRKAGACTECKSKKRRCTHVATSTSTDQLSPPRTTSEIGDSVSPGSTQTSNAEQSSPDTILEEVNHEGTEFEFEFDLGPSEKEKDSVAKVLALTRTSEALIAVYRATLYHILGIEESS